MRRRRFGTLALREAMAFAHLRLALLLARVARIHRHGRALLGTRTRTHHLGTRGPLAVGTALRLPGTRGLVDAPRVLGPLAVTGRRTRLATRIASARLLV